MRYVPVPLVFADRRLITAGRDIDPGTNKNGKSSSTSQ